MNSAGFDLSRLRRMIEASEGEELVPVAASLADSALLGGMGKTEPPPEPLPWRKWILWTTLIAVVAFLGWLTIRLVRKM